MQVEMSEECCCPSQPNLMRSAGGQTVTDVRRARTSLGEVGRREWFDRSVELWRAVRRPTNHVVGRRCRNATCGPCHRTRKRRRRRPPTVRRCARVLRRRPGRPTRRGWSPLVAGTPSPGTTRRRRTATAGIASIPSNNRQVRIHRQFILFTISRACFGRESFLFFLRA